MFADDLEIRGKFLFSQLARSSHRSFVDRLVRLQGLCSPRYFWRYPTAALGRSMGAVSDDDKRLWTRAKS